MSDSMRLELRPTAQQRDRLASLQTTFAQACNAVSPVVRERRLWHRVTLHHLLYRSLREAYPQLGSQMVCNAIYLVCRNARLVYQEGAGAGSQPSQWGATLPLLRFSDASPVLFDRRTLSLRDGLASLYTLEGRMHCECGASESEAARFDDPRLHDVLLQRDGTGSFELVFEFKPATARARSSAARKSAAALPGYLQVEAVA